MKHVVYQEFQANIGRVRSLVNIYEGLTTGRGRRPTHSTDILRAATVLLHAALEEVFRDLFRFNIPNAPREILNEIPLKGISNKKNAEKFFLGELTAFRGRFVENVLFESVDEYTKLMSLNRPEDIGSCLQKLGIEVAPFQQYFDLFNEAIKRRHQIVHQADRNEKGGSGQHRAQSISAYRVRLWIRNTEEFVEHLREQYFPYEE